jgi:hypothetical protein
VSEPASQLTKTGPRIPAPNHVKRVSSDDDAEDKDDWGDNARQSPVVSPYRVSYPDAKLLAAYRQEIICSFLTAISLQSPLVERTAPRHSAPAASAALAEQHPASAKKRPPVAPKPTKPKPVTQSLVLAGEY